ncbi:hypothetical protein KJ758_03560 [Patescibacteria group bacterium]|nr:hypothetical protein [Patescibacteria group bacterium]
MNQGSIKLVILFFISTSMVASLTLAAIAAPEVEDALPPREYLKEQCSAYECDFVLLDTIIDCESGWQMIKNKQSSAFGYFQILDSTEATTPQYQDGGHKTDPYANLDMGLYLYETRGSSPWNASRGCWQPKYYYKLNITPPECVGNCN